jgi:hypothetical protein
MLTRNTPWTDDVATSLLITSNGVRLTSAFAPHRHDTYAIGITLAGVQTFRYRSEQRHCLPG